ncbi:MAG: AraC family transcriptional regulator ligand-binding domain-containing protein [Myxococcales bacterium]|nr:AraC family transcriptional regulator ligand-binding domain-containing protein [Myxococcales bacterium]
MTTDSSTHAPTVALALFTPFIRMVERAAPDRYELGRVEVDALLDRWGLTAAQLEADPMVRLPYDLALALHELFVELFDDPSAPVRAGAHLEAGDYLLIEYVCSTCATVRDSIECLGEYYPLLIDAEYELVINGDLAEVRFRLAPELAAPPSFLEFAQASNQRMAMLHLDPAYAQLPVEVRFAHPKPAYAAVFEELFPCPVRFDCEHTATLFPASMLAAPMIKADPTLHMLLRDFARQQMDALPRLNAFPRTVRDAIAKSLPDGASLEEIAAGLGMGTSSLQARLRQHGMNYKALLEDVRRDQVKRLLRDPELSISEIAYRVGFAHPPALHRACKRWFGAAPSEYRASFKVTTRTGFWRGSR